MGDCPDLVCTGCGGVVLLGPLGLPTGGGATGRRDDGLDLGLDDELDTRSQDAADPGLRGTGTSPTGAASPAAAA